MEEQRVVLRTHFVFECSCGEQDMNIGVVKNNPGGTKTYEMYCGECGKETELVLPKGYELKEK